RYAAWIYPEGSLGGSSVLKLLKFQDWTTFGYNSTAMAPIQTVSLPGVGTNYHKLKMALDGNQISIFYDQNLVMTASDAEAQPYSSGGISLDMWTYITGYTMHADDVVVSGPVATQTITFTSPGSQTYGTAPFVLNASASS